MSFRSLFTRRALAYWALVAFLPVLSHRLRAQAPPAQTLVFPANADAYVDSGAPTTNFDLDPRLRARAPNVRFTYLRFAVTGVSGRTVQQARLRLGVAGAANSGGAVHTITNGTWNEATVTYNTRPAIDGPALASLGPVALGATVEFDLGTAIPGDGVYNLAIDSASTDGVTYNSNAATSGQKPELVLTVAAAGPTVTIAQPADGASFFVGDPVTLQATAVDAAGSDIAAGVTWTSSLDGALGTGPMVTAPALRQGTHVLTATVTDGGLTATDQATITLTPRPGPNTEPLVTITAPAAGAVLTSGAPVTFTGSANDLEDGNLTPALTWTSDRDGALGTGGSFTRTLSDGAHQISARAVDRAGLPGTATVAVQVVAPTTFEFPAVADAYVDAGAPSTNFGANVLLRGDANTARHSYLRFTVTGVGARRISAAVLRMKVDGVAGAESDSGGTVHSIGNDTWQESTVTYNTRPALDGPARATLPAVAVSQVVDFNVTAAITGDGTYNFALVNGSTNGVDYRSREGGPAPKLVLTVSGNAPSVAITAPPAGTVVFEGDGVTLTGTATDVESGDLSSQLRWSSSRDGNLGTGASIGTSALTVGTHTITASATDADGLRGERTITVRVRAPNTAPTVTITAPPPGTTVAVGTPVALQATVSDDFDTDLGGQVHWTSSLGGSLGAGAAVTAGALGLGTHTITATVTDSDGAMAAAMVTVTVTPAPPAVAVTAPAAGTRVFAGTPVAFSGSATDPVDGSLTATLTWTSDRDGVIGTGASFTRSDLSLGTHVVRAAVVNTSGLTGQVERTITVRPPNVAPTLSIVLPADAGTFVGGKPVLLAAAAADTEDGDLSAAVQWTSSRDGALGTGSPRIVPSLSVGTHTLTATVSDHDGAPASATVAVTVTPGTLTFLPTADTYVDAGSPSTKFGTATALLADASPVKQVFLRFAVTGLGTVPVERAVVRLTVGSGSADGSNVGGALHRITNTTWSEATTTYANRPAVDGPQLATRAAVASKAVVDFDVTSAITADGIYNLVLVSSSSDGVRYNSREATTGKPQLVVTLGQSTPPLVTISAPASGARVLPGAPVTLSGRATDAEDGDLTAGLAWRSDRDGALGTGGALTLTTLTPGHHTLTAEATDASGRTGRAQVTLDVAHPPVVAIVTPPTGSIFFRDDLPVTLAGTATDVEDGNLGAEVRWASDRDGALATGASILASALTTGTHVITASAVDDDGLRAEARVTIRVREANVGPTLAITAPPSGAAVPAGTSLGFTARAEDDFDGDLGSVIQWTSDRDGALGGGPARSAVLSEGAHTVTATVTDSDGVSASATVGVTITPSAPVVTITAPAAGTRVFAGTSLTFGATAADATDGNVGAALRWTSDIDGLIGLGAGFTTDRLSTGTHTIAATVTDAGGLTTTAERTAVVRPPNVPPTVAVVAPADGETVLAGRPVVLGAIAADTEDGDLSTAVRWTSSRDGVLGIGATLVAAGLSAGSHVLTATVTDLDGASATASVTVTSITPTLTFTPAADTFVDSGKPTTKFGTQASVQVGSGPTRQAFFRFAVSGIGGSMTVQQALVRLTVGSASGDNSTVGGTMQTTTSNAWSEATTTYNTRPVIDGPVLSTRAKVALKQVVDFDVTPAVTGDGTVNFALVSGSSDWVRYATREASTGKPQLIVTLKSNTKPVVNITSPADGTTVDVGAAVTFRGSAADAESGDMSAHIDWSSSLDGPLGTGATITLPMPTPGTHTITARVTDETGLTGEARITLHVGHPPRVAIAMPADRAVFFTTDLPVMFTATATDAEDGPLSHQLRWVSDRDGVYGVGPAVTVSPTVGLHRVSASVTDSHHLTGQAEVTIRVRTPNVAPVVAILAPADGASTPAGTPFTLTASATDDFDGDVSQLVQWTSSRDGVLGTGASRTAILSEGSHVLTATISDSDGVTASTSIGVTVTPTPPGVTISSPANGATAVLGASVSFVATAADATDGDLSAHLAWTSDLDGPIGTGAAFSTTALRNGLHTITASVTDAGGLGGEARVSLRVIRLPTVTILVPEPAAVYLTTTPVGFFATATDLVDGDLAAGLTWTSNLDGPIGTGPSLLVSTLRPGVHTVTASVVNTEGNPGTAQVTFTVQVAQAVFEPVADTYVDAALPTVRFGTAPELVASAVPERQAFLRFGVTGLGAVPVAQARLLLTVGGSSTAGGGAGGLLQRVSSNSWSETSASYSSRPNIDGVPLDGVTVPVDPGQEVAFDVTAAVAGNGTYSFGLTSPSNDAVRYESREGTRRPRLVVDFRQPETRRPPTVTITTPAPGTTVFDDQPVTFMAAAMDARDGTLDGAVTWLSDLGGPLGTGATITVPRLARGTHRVLASARNSLGVIGSAGVTVTVTDRPPAVVITAPAPNTLAAAGAPVTLTATAGDDVDGDLAASLVWTSDRDGQIGSGRSVTTSTLSAGAHVVTAAVTNSLGTTGSGTLPLFVGFAPPRVTIAAPTSGASVAEGAPLALAATATDVEDGDLSAAIAWASDLEGPLGTGATLSTVLSVAGPHRLTAAVTDSSGRTGSAAVTVTVTLAAPVVTITAPADGSSTAGPVTLTATAVDFRDLDLSAQIRWSSSVDGTLGTGASLAQIRLSAGSHVITAQVTDSSGLTAAARVTVVSGDTPPTVAITAPASGSSVAFGAPLVLTGTALDTTDGDLSAGLRWSSDLNGSLGTGASITVSTLVRGVHMITARATDSRGLSATAQARVTVTTSTAPNGPPQITITAPATGTQASAGAPLTFTGTALDETGDVSASLAWASDVDGFLGTGASITTTRLSLGRHHVTASAADGFGLLGTASITVDVTAPFFRYNAVADAYTDELLVDGNLGGATVLQADAQPIRRIYLRFQVTGLGPAPIARAVVRLQTTSATSAGGDLGGEIRTVSGPWDELAVTHTNKPLQDGVLLAALGPIVPSQNVDYDVTPAIAGDGTYNFGIKTTSSNGIEFVAREGGSFGPQLVVFRDAPPPADTPVVHITAPAAGTTLPVGVPATFTATATDAQDGDLGATISWQSDRDGALGTGASIARTLSAGAHAITAMATDTAGNPGTDRISVFVGSGGPTVTIAGPTVGLSVPFGTPVTFVGSAIDGRDGDVSFALQWTSSLDGTLATAPSFARTLSLGTHTITATVANTAGVSGSATTTVRVVNLPVGYQDFVYGSEIVNNLNKATAEKPESKLWYADGIWWATLHNTAVGAHRIHRLDLETQTWIDTGVLVDERGLSRQDVLFDGQKLYMVSRYAETPAQNRLLRYSYFPGAQTWVLDPGFPVKIPGGGTEALTVAKDSMGKLWIAYTLDSQVWVATTLASDREWGAPFVLPVAQARGLKVDDIAGILALPNTTGPGTPGVGKIGVFWSDQNTQDDYFAIHEDGTPPSDPATWHVETAGTGGHLADDHFNLKVAADGRVFAAIKTSFGANGQILVGLLVRSAAGVWSPLHGVTLVDFNPTRPRLILDEVSRRVYVFYSAFQNNIYYKSSDMDAIAFPGGVGSPFMVANNRTDVRTDGINNPTSTKQNIDPGMGLAVVASTPETSRYWHNVIAPKPVPQVRIAAPTTGQRVKAGVNLTFTGTATSILDGDVTASLRWTSNHDGLLGTGGTLTTNRLTAGLHEITATATDSSGVPGRATIMLLVEVDVAPVVTISQPTSTEPFRADLPVTFTGAAMDAFDGDRTAAIVWTSNRDGQLGTGGTISRILSVGTHTITARAKDLSNLAGTATVVVEVRSVGAPTLTLTSPVDGRTVATGASIAFAATATDPFDGNVTANVVWTSSRDGQIGTGGSFTRTTLTQGTHTVTATVTDSLGFGASASRTLTLVDDVAPVVTITAPAGGSLFRQGAAVTLRATAVDFFDGDRAASLRWTSNRDGNLGNGPVLTASTLTAGFHTVTASATDAAGLVGTAQVTFEVRHQPAPTVAITAPAEGAVLLVDGPITLTGTASDTIDGDVAGALQWTSSIDGTLGTGASITRMLGLGVHTLTASVTNSGGLTGSAVVHVHVKARPFVGILAPADLTTVLAGTPTTFTGFAIDLEEGDLSAGLAWTSSLDGPLGTGGSLGRVLTRGVHAITATAADSDGHEASATIAVTVNGPPTVAITSPASGGLFGFGAHVTLAGTASDQEDGDLSASLTWTSSLDGVLGTASTLTVVSLRSGTHTVTARTTDSRGVAAQAQVTVVVNDPPTLVITGPANGAVFQLGIPVILTATATDREDGDLGAAIVWSSNVDGTIGPGASRSFVPSRDGPQTITATVTDQGGRSVSATRTIEILP